MDHPDYKTKNDCGSADRTVGTEIGGAGAALYARVCLLDISYLAHRLFDYKVPPDMTAVIGRGDFVRVPFGKANRGQIALVADISDSPSDVSVSDERIKEISEMLPRELALTAEQMRLCEYMYEHVLCSYTDAVHALIPSFMLGKSDIIYKLSDDGRKMLAGLRTDIHKRENMRVREALLSAIEAAGGSISRKKLLSGLGETDVRILPYLERTGAIESEFSLTRIGKKYDDVVRLAVSPEEAFEQSELRIRRAPLMSAVLRELCSGDKTMSELRELTGAGKSVFDRLISAGLVTVDKNEIYRMPSEGEQVRDSPPDENLLTDEQSKAYNTLCGLYGTGEGRAALLHGVTGSGKTRVIKAMIDRVTADGRQAIVLVPEISLTPQTVGYFRSCYGSRVAVIHSMLSQGERYDAWRSIKRGDVDICIGTRSAVFAPFDNIGLIVIDEEQEHTYKSDTSPKYNARDIARFRCSEHGALLLLASATPSVDSYYRAVSGRYTLVELKKRYSGVTLPDTVISDVTELHKCGVGLIGEELDAEIRSALSAGRQIILFMNRRGYNHFITCPVCREPVKCPNCSVSLTYHANDFGGELRCHLCGYKQHVPQECPSCGGQHFVRIGFGIQRVEQELYERYPGVRVMRMDADTTSSKGAFYEMLEGFRRGDADILIGTQMVTKGHDFPNVDVSGVVLADTALYLDDYRANERTFSMITQLIGRAGRAGVQGRSVIQTCTPDHPVIRLAASQDYRAFYDSEIKLRRAMLFPPFCRIALISVTAEDERDAAETCTKLYKDLEAMLTGEFSDVRMICFGPYEASVYRVKGRYRYRIMCKMRSDKRTRLLLRTLLEKYSGRDKDGCTVNVDIDPGNL